MPIQVQIEGVSTLHHCKDCLQYFNTNTLAGPVALARLTVNHMIDQNRPNKLTHSEPSHPISHQLAQEQALQLCFDLVALLQ